MEQNMDHIELFTKQGIFIPQISIHYTQKIIKTIFKLSNIGHVDTVELIPLHDNEEMQSAIVYFKLSEFSYKVAYEILNNNSYNLYLEDDECWILMKNKNPSSERALMNESFSTRDIDSTIVQLEEEIEKQNEIILEQTETIHNLMKGIKVISKRFDSVIETVKVLQKTMNDEKKYMNLWDNK